MTWGSEGASTISQSNRFSFENPRCTNLHVKATVLLQAHFSTQSVSGNLALDLLEVLLSGSKIASSNGYQEQPTACHQKRLPLKEFKGKAEGSNLFVDVMITPPHAHVLVE